MTIKDKLNDLFKQATEERSHFYVASCVKESLLYITELEQQLATRTEELRKEYLSAIDWAGKCQELEHQLRDKDLERLQWQNRADDYSSKIEELSVKKQSLEQQLAERDKLLNEFEKYIWHSEDCAAFYDLSDPCTCGVHDFETKLREREK